MPTDSNTPLCNQVKALLKRKGIKYSHFSPTCIFTRSHDKNLHPVILSFHEDRVTIQAIPITEWSFTCTASTPDEVIVKAQRFRNQINICFEPTNRNNL